MVGFQTFPKMEPAKSSTKLKDSRLLMDESDRNYDNRLTIFFFWMKQVNNLYLETKEAHMRDTLQSSPLKSLQ